MYYFREIGKDRLIQILTDEMKKEIEQQGCTYVDHTTGIEQEIESFIMQGKSCLDVLVKIFKPLIGKTIHSYGNSGDKVVNILKNNLKDNEAVTAIPLIKMIDENKEWIERWFKTDRDTISHYRTFKSTGFARDPKSQKFELPKTPDGIGLHEIVTKNYYNLLSFCEDFIPSAVSIKFHPFFSLILLPEDRRNSEFPMKFAIGMKR